MLRELAFCLRFSDRLAAENQLMDADDASILWFGFAANMVRADGTKGDWVPEDGRKENTDGYTLGDLRYAISQAGKAAAARDTHLWGDDPNTGGSYEGQAMAVCEFFANEPDSFFLPEVHVETNQAGHCQLVFHEGEPGNRTGAEVVICEDFDKFLASDKTRDSRRVNAWLDRGDPNTTSEDWVKKESVMAEVVQNLEEVHGVDRSTGPQSLAVLCVRELHKAGYEFAAGTADPNEVAARVMALAAEQSDDDAAASDSDL